MDCLPLKGWPHGKMVCGNADCDAGVVVGCSVVRSITKREDSGCVAGWPVLKTRGTGKRKGTVNPACEAPEPIENGMNRIGYAPTYGVAGIHGYLRYSVSILML